MRVGEEREDQPSPAVGAAGPREGGKGTEWKAGRMGWGSKQNRAGCRWLLARAEGNAQLNFSRVRCATAAAVSFKDCEDQIHVAR